MKKFKTTDEKVAYIVKKMVKMAKGYLAETGWKNLVFEVRGNFCTWCSSDGKNVKYTIPRTNEEIPFGDISDQSIGELSMRIGNGVLDALKMKKDWAVVRKYDQEWARGSVWSSHKYNVFVEFTIVRVCKEFASINKKLAKLGAKPIEVADWYEADVSGKRSHIFSREYWYCASNQKKCASVLEWLKGKKKATYEMKDEADYSDREYGERYETEWGGHEWRSLVMIDSKGHRQKFL